MAQDTSRQSDPLVELVKCVCRRAAVALALLAGPTLVPWAGSALVSSAAAQDVSHRVFGADDGLTPPFVVSLAQDRTGFLWVGTAGGLFRYDGVEMRAWGRESLDRTIVRIVPSPTDGLAVLREGGALFAVTLRGVEAIPGPDGEALRDVGDVAYDEAGGLWIIRAREVWRRDPAGAWTRRDVPLAEGERLGIIRRHAGDAVHVSTTHGVWRLRPSASARRLPLPRDRPDPVVVDVHTTEDGRVLILSWTGRVTEVGEGGSREVFSLGDLGLEGRAMALLDRGRTTWIAVDRYLVGWRGAEPPVVLGPAEGINSGGELLVDDEGSLWMGSFAGLYQFPEPETLVWSERSGLPSSHTRYLARTDDGVWITTWGGAARLRRAGGRSAIDPLTGWTPSHLFVDSRSVLWAGSDRGILEIRGARTVRSHIGGQTSLYGFHEEPDGTVWLATDRGLYVVARDDGVAGLVSLDGFTAPETPVHAVLVDRRGFLWAAAGEVVCYAAAEVARRRAGARWRCETVPGMVHVIGGGLVEMPSGALWLSTSRLGVLRRTDAGWAEIPGVRQLASRTVLSLVPARSGGVWVVGHGVLQRVAEAPHDPLGWRVEERLTTWHGLPATGGGHVLEDADGGVWITTSVGVVHVPAAARFAIPARPSVVLVDARVDDEPVPLQSALDLPHDRNRLELRFAAVSYRDPSLIRYQVRLREDAEWVATAGAPSFRWVDLPAGRYAAQVRASLDGVSWSTAPGPFSFRVSPPWYRQPWAFAGFIGLAGIALLVAHRLRVRRLLALERQRTRIAMDLHDEMGSGLGSIGILSGLLAADRMEPPDRRVVAGEIATTAGELGTALSQIVWSLDPKATPLVELAGRLTELGGRLFAGSDAEFAALVPERWPNVRATPLVRRNVMLIGLEGLHNAARHARADRVELRIEPEDGGRWRMEVVDDGVGLGDGANRSGMGLRSMRRRAEEIGAELTWSSPDGGGTVVALRFWPRPRAGWGRMIMRWRPADRSP